MPKVGLGYRGRLRGDLAAAGQEIDLTHQAIVEWREQQHDIDGGHTDITCETLENDGLTSLGGPWRMPIEAVLTPPYTVTANQDNYEPRDLDRALVVRIATDASRTFTGIVTNKDEFRYLRLINVGNFNFVLAHNSASSRAPFRFACPLGVDVTIGSAGSVNLWYDRHSANWRIVGYAGDVSGIVTSSGGTAPDDAQYLVAASHADLSAERVTTNSTSNTWNTAVAGQVAVERAALTGDVTASANSNATTIANNAVTTTKILDANVTLAKMADLAADKLIGRGNGGGTGVPQAITLGTGLSLSGTTLNASAGSGTVTTTGSPANGNLTKFTGTTSISNADLTGDVTTSGTVATTIANDAVTYAKMQNISAADRLLGRGNGGGSGDTQELTLGTGLSLSGTTLNASPSGGGGGSLGASYKLYGDGAAVGSPNNTSENDLKSYTLPANTMTADGDVIRITAAGTYAAVSRTRTVTVYFGTQGLVTFSSSSNTSVHWRVDLMIVRTASSTQVGTSTIAVGVAGAVENLHYRTRGGFAYTRDLTASQVIKVTATVSAGAATNDIVNDFLVVEKL